MLSGHVEARELHTLGAAYLHFCFIVLFPSFAFAYLFWLPCAISERRLFSSQSSFVQLQAVRADLAKIALTAPVCTAEGEKIALSRRVEKHWRCVMMSRTWSKCQASHNFPISACCSPSICCSLRIDCRLIGWGEIRRGITIEAERN